MAISVTQVRDDSGLDEDRTKMSGCMKTDMIEFADRLDGNMIAREESRIIPGILGGRNSYSLLGRKSVGEGDFEERIKSSIWDVLSLRCLLDKQLWILNSQM